MPFSRSGVVPGLALGFALLCPPLTAQSLPSLPSGALGQSAQGPEIDSALQQEIRAALAVMGDSDLSLTYARIHHAFRQTLGMDDLTAARRLVDYAALAETELNRRAIPHPIGTESAAQMGIDFELVL